MGKLFFDLTDGDLNISMGNNMMMDPKGDLLLKTSKNTAIDLNTGGVHIITSSNDDDD
ncbi:MAG: hypothetical protein K6G51_02465 [Sphaerochaetaceae bacterium]|nr:hypothetical protein [Sphaerochaetaceae bacterium]